MYWQQAKKYFNKSLAIDAVRGKLFERIILSRTKEHRSSSLPRSLVRFVLYAAQAWQPALRAMKGRTLQLQ